MCLKFGPDISLFSLLWTEKTKAAEKKEESLLWRKRHMKRLFIIFFLLLLLPLLSTSSSSVLCLTYTYCQVCLSACTWTPAIMPHWLSPNHLKCLHHSIKLNIVHFNSISSGGIFLHTNWLLSSISVGRWLATIFFNQRWKDCKGFACWLVVSVKYVSFHILAPGFFFSLRAFYLFRLPIFFFQVDAGNVQILVVESFFFYLFFLQMAGDLFSTEFLNKDRCRAKSRSRKAWYIF